MAQLPGIGEAEAGSFMHPLDTPIASLVAFKCQPSRPLRFALVCPFATKRVDASYGYLATSPSAVGATSNRPTAVSLAPWT